MTNYSVIYVSPYGNLRPQLYINAKVGQSITWSHIWNYAKKKLQNLSALETNSKVLLKCYSVSQLD